MYYATNENVMKVALLFCTSPETQLTGIVMGRIMMYVRKKYIFFNINHYLYNIPNCVCVSVCV